MIEIEQLKVHYGDFCALNNINLQIKDGEFFTFLGPSGCGKTTMLRTIAGFISPSEGKIIINNQEVTHLSVGNRNIGMVFQNYALFPTMNVYENIAFGLKVKKLPKEEIEKAVFSIAQKVDLDRSQLQKKISELSGGQQQRVAIARALVMQPTIACLDEPLSNLDAKLRIQLRNELKDLQKKFGITTIYVTHDQEEALTLSDRIAIFNKGVIEQIGTPEEIYNRSATEFVCNFIGDINVINNNVMTLINQQVNHSFEIHQKHYIRLEKLRILSSTTQPSESDIILDAIIQEVEFYGMYIKYYLHVVGEPMKCIEREDGGSIYKKNDAVKILLNPNHIMKYRDFCHEK